MLPNPSQIRAALPATIAQANQWNLGRHVYGEWDVRADDGTLHQANLFEGGGVLFEDGHYAPTDKRYFFDRQIFVLSDAPPVTTTPPVNGGQLPQYKFPLVLTEIGAVGSEGVPLFGQPFYRLHGASVRRGVSAFVVATVFDKTGIPKAGVKVVVTYGDGNGEVLTTDASGFVQHNMSQNSSFDIPGTAVRNMFVANDNAWRDNDAKQVWFTRILSDIVKSLGDWQGEHTEIYLQFVEY